MKNPELFHKTVGILVNAYLNNTLRHGSCMACACGNIIAGNNNWLINSPEWDEDKAVWFSVFSIKSKFDGIETKQIAKNQVKSTGYSIKDFIAIERAFEGARIDKFVQSERNMYAGLMAVCDTLMIIHKATKTETQQAKQLFTKETIAV